VTTVNARDIAWAGGGAVVGDPWYYLDSFRAAGEDFANLTDNTPTLNVGISAVAATGGGNLVLPTQLRLDGLVTALAGKSNVRLVGHGVQSTNLRINSVAGHLFDLTNSSFCGLTDATLTFQAKKTAGAVFHADQSGGNTCQQNDFRRLWILSGYRAFDFLSCGTQTVEDVQFGDTAGSDNTWGWDFFLNLNGAISCQARGLRGGTAWGCTSGVANIAGVTDTFHAHDWDLAAQSGVGSTTMKGIVHTSGAWSKFVKVSIESGGADWSLTVNGGTQPEFHACHLLGRNVIQGGTGLKMIGGECLLSNIHGLQIAGGTDTEILGVNVHDVAVGWNCIDVSNGVNDFTIALCQLGRQGFGGGQPLNLIRVGSSANAQDRYIVSKNRGRNYTGTAFVDNGTGVNKDVATPGIFVP
jgi:hypothetical protein